MFKRHIKSSLEKALARSRVILLNGARQVGKTTLVKELVKDKDYTYEDRDAWMRNYLNLILQRDIRDLNAKHISL